MARFFVASGEAALVPAAVALLAELFSQERRSMAMECLLSWGFRWVWAAACCSPVRLALPSDGVIAFYVLECGGGGCRGAAGLR
ncbi:hypothetical protein ACU4GD_36570 [Cupriavidus basilensis]